MLWRTNNILKPPFPHSHSYSNLLILPLSFLTDTHSLSLPSCSISNWSTSVNSTGASYTQTSILFYLSQPSLTLTHTHSLSIPVVSAIGQHLSILPELLCWLLRIPCFRSLKKPLAKEKVCWSIVWLEHIVQVLSIVLMTPGGLMLINLTCYLPIHQSFHLSVVRCTILLYLSGTTGCACLIHFAGMDVDTAIRTAKRCRPIIDPIGQVHS